MTVVNTVIRTLVSELTSVARGIGANFARRPFASRFANGQNGSKTLCTALVCLRNGHLEKSGHMHWFFGIPFTSVFVCFKIFNGRNDFSSSKLEKKPLRFREGFFSSLELEKSFLPKPLLNDVFHVFSWNIEASLSHKWNFTWQHQHGLWHEVFVFRDKK